MGIHRPDRSFVIAPKYSEAWDFSEGLAPVWPDSDGGFVYIDRTGKQVLQAERR